MLTTVVLVTECTDEARLREAFDAPFPTLVVNVVATLTLAPAVTTGVMTVAGANGAAVASKTVTTAGVT